ncbi:CHAT domain-containing protein [Actinomadura terrae]|uniref:CHAT domain-containing protein n=1 Tax=Actinomadura terrae TaxID=604353 RepID=UPI001FA7AD52|nr:CHAT domain-containing protein [Actinomadura terrae]
MGHPDGPPEPDRGTGGLPPDATDLEGLRAAWRELNDVVEEIRRVPGYEDFMAAPTFEDVAAAATRPLCYVSAAESEGLALIVRNEGGTASVEHLRLPALTADEVRRRVSALLTSYAEVRTVSGTGREVWSAELDAATRWAWDAVMGPLLDRLRDDPAMTLVPGGLLGLLPLHAAWTPDAARPTGRFHALDETTISYAPNARSLTAATRIAERSTAGSLLAVVEPRPLPPRFPAMPFTGLEASTAAGAVAGTPRTLAGTAATLAAVLRELPSSDLVHFACHGFADLENPLDSGLVLAGGEPLRVRDLLTMDLRIGLVVLSSCETSMPGVELPDEVISLPTGLLQAGAAAVVAPLWEIPDLRTSMLMTEFYRGFGEPGWTPAEALRRAQLWLRDGTNAEKAELWGRALEGEAGWPPPDVADALIDNILEKEPDERDDASIAIWGAFGHVGV